MPQITNESQIRVVNEELRPLCENIRALVARYSALVQRWNANDMASVADGDTFERSDVPTINGAEIKAIKAAFDALATAATADASAVAVINKACVRPLTVG